MLIHKLSFGIYSSLIQRCLHFKRLKLQVSSFHGVGIEGFVVCKGFFIS